VRSARAGEWCDRTVDGAPSSRYRLNGFVLERNEDGLSFLWIAETFDASQDGGRRAE